MREPGRVPGWSCRKESGEACSLIFWAAISSAIATKIKTLNIAEIGVTRNWIDLSSFVSLLETSFKGVQFFLEKHRWKPENPQSKKLMAPFICIACMPVCVNVFTSLPLQPTVRATATDVKHILLHAPDRG